MLDQMRLSNLRIVAFAVAILTILIGCGNNYKNVKGISNIIEFKNINFKCSAEHENWYVLDKGGCNDTHEMLKIWANDWGLDQSKMKFSNPANEGMTSAVEFSDGGMIVGLWYRKSGDKAVENGVENHELYHAINRLSPNSVEKLFNHLRVIGYNIDYKKYDEEMCASIIEVISIELSGIKLQDVNGTGLTSEAKNIVIKSKSGLTSR